VQAGAKHSGWNWEFNIQLLSINKTLNFGRLLHGSVLKPIDHEKTCIDRYFADCEKPLLQSNLNAAGDQ
jgi:hypothetical protein